MLVLPFFDILFKSKSHPSVHLPCVLQNIGNENNVTGDIYIERNISDIQNNNESSNSNDRNNNMNINDNPRFNEPQCNEFRI